METKLFIIKCKNNYISSYKRKKTKFNVLFETSYKPISMFFNAN